MKQFLRFSLFILITGFFAARADYCEPSSDTSWDEYVTGVEFNTIDNSSDASDDGYEDYTNLSTEVTPGETYDITVEYSGPYGSYSAFVWIDFNQDEEFDNDTSTELFELSESGDDYTGTITIPEDATEGETRMRVRLFYGTTNNGPCYTGGFGESEDYTIEVAATGTDIAVNSITLPSQPYYEGEYEVSASVKWIDGEDAEKFILHWEANGEYQGSVDWSGTMNAGNSMVSFDLGTVDFTYPEDEYYYLPFYVKVWVDYINGDDGDLDNDNNYLTKNTTPILDDAGITEIVQPKGNVSLGEQDIIVTLHNYGAKNLTSLNIEWEIDGVSQDPYEWTGDLPSDESVDVTLGAFNFVPKTPLAPYVISASANLEGDENTDNDTGPVSTVGPPVVPDTYIIGGDEGFKTIEELNSYITSSGIAGEGVYNFIIEPGTYDDMLEFPLDELNKNYEFVFKSGNCDPDDVKIRVTGTAWDDALVRMNNMYNIEICGITFEMPSGLGKALEFNNGNAIVINNCVFNYGGTGIEQNYNGTDFRHLEITNCEFNDLTNYGIVQNYAGSDKLNYTLIEDNEFKGLNVKMKNPILVSNGSVIKNNLFKDLLSKSLSDENVLIKMYGSGRHTAIEENATLRVENYSGIQIVDAPHGKITKNNFRIGGTGDYNALYMGYTNLETYQNNFVISGKGSAVKIHGSQGIFSNNMVVGLTDNIALESYDNAGIYVIYNSIQNISDNSPTVEIANENAKIYRNIFSAIGDAPVISLMNSGEIGLDENTYYTENDVFALHNGQPYSDYEGWKSISGKDAKSNFEKPPYKNDDNLHIIRVSAGLVAENPVNLELDEEQRTRHENTDYNDDYRGYQDEYYKGADAVMPEITIVDDPQNILTCQGDTTVMLNVSATVTYGAEIKYQWYFDGEAIAGATNPLFTFDEGTTYKNSGYYACEISVTGGKEPIMSNTAAVYILTKPEILKETYLNKTQGTEDRFALVGDVVYLGVETHMRGITPPYYKDKFQWYFFDSSENLDVMLENNDPKYSGVESSELVINEVTSEDLEDGNYYYVVIEALCGTITTDYVLSEAPEYSITFNTEPVSQEICENQDMQFVADAVASQDVDEIKFQWYKDDIALEDDLNYSGTNTNTLDISKVNDSNIGEYHLSATTVPGDVTFVTEKAMLTVMPLPEITRNIEQDTVKVEMNSNLNLEITALDADSYQWYKDFNPIDGEVSSALDIVIDSEDQAGEYYCVASNACGDMMSEMAVVEVMPEGWVSVNSAEENSFALYTAEPNPVSNISTIRFNLETSQYAEIILTDAFGQKVAVLFEGIAKAGINKVELNADKLANGVYYYSLVTSANRITKKLLIVK